MTKQLPAEVRDLLVAIRETLDVPFAAPGDNHAERQYVRLLEYRVWHLRGILGSILADPVGVTAVDARTVRQSTADTPVTYPVYIPAGKDTGTADQTDAGESTRTEAMPGIAALAHGGMAALAWAQHQTAAPTPDACGRCRRPFDPADVRFDGHARHRDTPWCRRCVDLCHEAGADHQCDICRTPAADETTGGAR